MTLAKLTDKELKVIQECLKAAAYGPFFVDSTANDPFWEIHTIFGLSMEELKVIADKWPSNNLDSEQVNLAINNSMNNLIGYPHGVSPEVWSEYISVSREEVSRIFMKWRKISLGLD